MGGEDVVVGWPLPLLPTYYDNICSIRLQVTFHLSDGQGERSRRREATDRERVKVGPYHARQCVRRLVLRPKEVCKRELPLAPDNGVHSSIAAGPGVIG